MVRRFLAGAEIAELLEQPLSTVTGILTRIGIGRLGRLGMEPARRHERERPGERIHIRRQKRSGASRAARANA